MNTVERPRIGVIDAYPHLPNDGNKANKTLIGPTIEVAKLLALDTNSPSVLSRLGLQVSQGHVNILERVDVNSPNKFAQSVVKAFSEVGVSHVVVLGNQRMPDSITQKYTGKMIRLYPGVLDPTHLDENGEPLDFGRLEGRRPSYGSLSFAQIAGGPFSTNLSLQHVQDEGWVGDLAATRTITFSWAKILGANTIESLRRATREFPRNAGEIHQTVFNQTTSLIKDLLEGLGPDDNFPSKSLQQFLVADGKEHLLYEARKFAQELPI